MLLLVLINLFHYSLMDKKDMSAAPTAVYPAVAFDIEAKIPPNKKPKLFISAAAAVAAASASDNNNISASVRISYPSATDVLFD